MKFVAIFLINWIVIFLFDASWRDTGWVIYGFVICLIWNHPIPLSGSGHEPFQQP